MGVGLEEFVFFMAFVFQTQFCFINPLSSHNCLLYLHIFWVRWVDSCIRDLEAIPMRSINKKHWFVPLRDPESLSLSYIFKFWHGEIPLPLCIMVFSIKFQITRDAEHTFSSKLRVSVKLPPRFDHMLHILPEIHI